MPDSPGLEKGSIAVQAASHVSQIEFVVGWVTLLGAVLLCFVFLWRRFDERLSKVDERFDRQDGKIEGLREEIVAVRLSQARIEGVLGINITPVIEQPQAAGESPPAIAHPTSGTPGGAGSAPASGAEVAAS